MVDKRAVVKGVGQGTTPGVIGEAATAPGVYGESSNGPGGEFVGNELAVRGTLLTGALNSLQTVAEFRRETTGASAAGCGGSVDLKVEEPGGDVTPVYRLAGTRGNGYVVVELRSNAIGDAVGNPFLKATDDGTDVTTELAMHKPADEALATHSGANPPGWSRWAFTAADIVAIGEVVSGEIDLCTLARGHVIHAVILNVVTAETALDDLTLSIGVTGTDYIDLLTASNAQAQEVYGNAAAELGTSLTDGIPYVCLTDDTTVKIQAVSTDEVNDFTDAEDLVFEVYLLVSKIPSMTAASGA